MRRITDALSRRPDVVFWLIAAYYVVAVVARVLRSEGLQTDEGEQLFQSQFLLMGYGRQPPFYNWLQYGAIHVLGPSIFALSLVKNLLLLLCCLFYGLAARLVLKDTALPFAAMLGVVALPAISVLAQRDLSHAVATMFAVSLFFYAYLLTLTRPSLWSYLLTGMAVGIGVISKYNFVIVPLAALLAILPETELRKRLFDWRLIPALVLAAAICVPHMLWVLQNVSTATSGTIDAMRADATGNPMLDRLTGLFMLLVAALESALPILAFFLIAFRRDLIQAWKTETLWTRVIGRALLMSLVLVGLIGIGFGATTISQKWLSPFLLLLPLYLCLKLDAAGAETARPTARLAWPVSLLAFGFVLYLALGNLVGPLIGRQPKENLPSVPFIRQVLAERGLGAEPAYIIAADPALAAAARLAAPEARIVLPSFTQAPPLEASTAKAQGLVIWKAEPDKAELPESVRTFLAALGLPSVGLLPAVLTVPYLFSGGRDKASFGYAWIGAS
ncbi:ArnT family glycosyltransferase [Rhizobium deserti]|nr:glycosyltransferase family 39 protein [Rhizobium deserti]